MELDFETKTVSSLRCCLWQTQDREMTQEVRIGDGMPDIGSVLATRGQCILRSKEWSGDSISISGGVMVWVLYAPADGSEPKTIEAWVPVQLKWELREHQYEGTIRGQMSLCAADARSLSARKLMVRVNVSATAEAMEADDTQVYLPPETEQDIQLLRNTYPMMLPVEAGEKPFLIDEELELPAAAHRIICCELRPCVSEQKVVGRKAVFRGDVLVHLCCQTEEGAVFGVDLQVPYAQFSELDRDYDKEAAVTVVPVVTNLEPEIEDERLRLRCSMVAQYLVQDRVMVELVEDAYSPERSVQLHTGTLALGDVLEQSSQPIRSQVVLPCEAAKVEDAWVYVAQPKVRRAGELAEIALEGLVGLLYTDREGQLRSCNATWSEVWEFPAAQEVQIQGQLHGPMSIQTIPGPEQVEMRLEMMVGALAISDQQQTMVTGLELGQIRAADPDRPSLILCRAGKGGLWALAKASGSTVDAIRTANSITDDPAEGRLLLIPVR